MNKFFLSTALLVCMAGTLSAKNEFTVLENNAFVAGASPNGKYVVGYNPYYNDCNVYMESFLFDYGSDDFEWVTRWDENDRSGGGQFCGVSNDGTVCGTSPDTDHVITWVDEFFGENFSGPTQVATIWENGVRKSLPYGEIDINEFSQLEDGTFGVAISGEGNTVAGFVAYGNMGTVKPCAWNRDTEGKWSLSLLPLPENASNPVVSGISEDGSVILGGIYGEDGPKVIYWENGECRILDGPEKQNPGEWVNMQPLSISPDGRFVAIAYNMKGMVYDRDRGEYRLVPPFSDYSNLSQKVAIDNAGNVYGNYAGYPSSRPFVYLYADDRILDMGYYLSVCAPDMNPEISFEPGSQVMFNAVSADGRYLAGNSSLMFGSGWVMELDVKKQIFPTMPVISYAFSRNLNEVTLRWESDNATYDGYAIKAYNIYRNGVLLKEVAADSESFELVINNEPTGYPEYMIESVFTGNDGSELRSPKSNPVSVAVAPDYSLPLADDFESSTQTNYWSTSVDYGNALDTGWSCFMGAGMNDTNGLYSTVSSQTPYSFSIISRPLDAREENQVTVSFGFIFALLNEPVQILDKDFISVECSYDMGDSWKEIKSWSLAEMSAGNWCYKSVDISELAAGKLFSLRLRRHGEGVAQYISAVDKFAVNISADMLTPTGLSGARIAENSATLVWKSPSECYNLNNICNLRTMNMAFGNEGKEMIGANLFTTDDLIPYAGKYITSVSALINYFNWQEDDLGIHAAAVIFEDGKIVREQEIEEIVYNGYSVVNLDEPLLIDATKELKVGIRIHDYDDWQWPAVAAVADDYIPGKTDLYSYDNGETWSNLSDLYDPADIQGHCLWDITAHVTDGTEYAEIDFFDKPMLYNVFRDGKLLNTVAIDGNATRFNDNAAYDNASYQVMAYSANGEISELSEAFTLVATGIIPVSGNRAEVMSDGKYLYASTEAVRMTVINTDGRVMSSAAGNTVSVEGLPDGIYLITVEFPDRMESVKTIVRN